MEKDFTKNFMKKEKIPFAEEMKESKNKYEME